MPLFEDANDDFEHMSVSELNQLIKDTSEILKYATGNFNAHAKEIKKTEDELAPVAKKYRELLDRKKVEEEALKKIKPEIDNAKTRLERLQHWLRRSQLRLLEEQEFENLSRELDDLTRDATWRRRNGEGAFDHQIEGAKRIALVGGRAVLGDKRGLGKSLTSLITCDMLKSRKIIVFAPKETIKNFQDEIKRWAPKRTLIDLVGKNKMFRDFVLDTLQKTDEWILCVNLEAWRRDQEFISKLIKLQADTVVIDEAHFIKDPNGVAWQGIEKVVSTVNKCVLCGNNSLKYNDQKLHCVTSDCAGVYKHDDENTRSVRHVIPMTGTPILNNPKELWPLLNLIDPKSFPSEHAYLKEYCEKIGAGKYRFKSGGEEMLLKRIGNQFIQRDRKSAGVIIPPQTIQYHDIEFDKVKYAAQYRAYQELKDQWVIFSNEMPEMQMSMPNKISVITRLRQMMVWPGGITWRHPLTKEIIFQCDVNQSIKIDYAVDLIKELVEEGERVVLFSQFKHGLEELYRRLSKIAVDTNYGNRYINPVVLNGDTPDYLRAKIRYDFDARNKSNQWDIVLAHYRVGGQSLNFTAASQMVILDREWNDGREDQSRGRIDRLGQTKETTVHVLRVDSTIDTWMDALILQKKAIVDGFEDTYIDLVAKLRKAIEDGEI